MAVRSFSALAHPGDDLDLLSLPVRAAVPIPPGAGKNRFTTPSRSFS